jgi:hypothetical protein
MNRLLTTAEKLEILDEIQTIFVTGKGMPTSGNDSIMKKLQALITDQSERQADVGGKVKDALVEEIKSTFYIHYQMDNEDGDEQTTEILESVVSTNIDKLNSK